MSDDDLILREDALEAAYVTSSLELARHSEEKIVERIQALPAVTVQAQIDAAVAAERERWVKAIEHYFDATAVMDVEQYVDRFRKGASHE